MSQTSHTSAAIALPQTGGDTPHIADENVAQLLSEAVLMLKKIEYHLSLMTDTDLSNTEF